jgi:hypothetical protein
MNNPTVDQIIRDYLGYEDVLCNQLEKHQNYVANLKNPRIRCYAEHLRGILQERGEAVILAIVANMIRDCEAVVNAAKVEPSREARSRTWALWDMAKQNYYATNPGQCSANYSPAVWTQKQREIVDRHIGWEVHMSWKPDPEQQSEAAEFDRLLSTPRNDRGFLPSYALAALGAITRRVVQNNGQR